MNICQIIAAPCPDYPVKCTGNVGFVYYENQVWGLEKSGKLRTFFMRKSEIQEF